MSKVCNSWAELEMALQQAMYDAIDEATQNSYEDLKENVDLEWFYRKRDTQIKIKHYLEEKGE